MRVVTVFAPLISVGTVVAQNTKAYTDPKSGISFQAFTDANSGYTFGIALPTVPKSDFIGQLVGKGSGWTGLSLGGAMLNHLLIAAWPNGQSIVSTFRRTANYGSPAVATGSWSIKPIDSGTYVNSTHYSFTFLCSGCITSDTLTFNANSSSTSFGWALATVPPANKASGSSTLNKHASQGKFGADLSGARSSQYDTWAALAGGSQTTLSTSIITPTGL